MVAKNQKKYFLDQSALHAAEEWLKAEKEKIPSPVFEVMSFLLILGVQMDRKIQMLKSMQKLLIKVWGLSPSSEKIRTETGGAPPEDAPEGDKKPHHKRAGRRKPKKKVRRYNPRKGEVSQDKGETQQDNSSMEPLHPQLSEGPTASAEKVPEKAIELSQGEMEASMKNPQTWAPNMTQRGYTRVELRDLRIHWVEQPVRMERLTNLQTGEFIQAKNPYGPEGSRYTYQTIVNLLVLHVGHHLPLHRLAHLFSTSTHKLPKSVILWFMTFSAQAFLPIFLKLCEQLMRLAKVIETDDTKTRINKRDADAFLEKLVSNPKTDAEKVAARVHQEIDLSAKTGKKTKKAFLTAITGLLDDKDPTSRVVIKLTHFGQAGDLLGRLLERYRDPKQNPELWLVADLAESNTPRGKLEKFTIRRAGCLWHARRRFYAARDLDDLMWYGLRCFSAFAALESWLKRSEASEQQILQRRRRYGTVIKKILEYACKLIQKKWPKGSVPWDAAEYFLSNEHTLLQFLRFPFLPISNNRCERLLRPEKLMLSASKFRDTMGGRVTYDVIATIIASCGVAQVNFFDYAMDVLQNRDAVAQNPEAWTPLAWRERKRQQRTQVS